MFPSSQEDCDDQGVASANVASAKVITRSSCAIKIVESNKQQMERLLLVKRKQVAILKMRFLFFKDFYRNLQILSPANRFWRQLNRSIHEEINHTICF